MAKRWLPLLAAFSCVALASGQANTQGSAAGLTGLLDKVNEQLSQQLSPEQMEKVKQLQQGLLSQFDLEELANGDYGQLARDSPLGFLALLSTLPKEEQRSVLKNVGAAKQERTGQVCNIFGGEDSCMTLSDDSELARLCPEHDLKVDCAYYLEELAQVRTDPNKVMKDVLGSQAREGWAQACPQCFDKQRQLYCLTAVPKCGSFAAQVETAVLPAAEAVFSGLAEGESTNAGLAQGAPLILKAISLALPCREMCESLRETCSCGQALTVGSSIDQINSEYPSLPVLLLQPFRNYTACDLFSPSSAPGFAGHCETVAQQCTDRATWCQPGGALPQLSQALLVNQVLGLVTNALQSWMLSLLDDLADVNDDPALNDLSVRVFPAGSQQDSKQDHSSWLVAVGVVIGVAAVCSVAAVLGGLWYFRSRLQPRRAAGGPQYVAMTDTERLLDPPTAELPSR